MQNGERGREGAFSLQRGFSKDTEPKDVDVMGSSENPAQDPSQKNLLFRKHVKQVKVEWA